MISSSQRPLPDNTRHSQQTNIHAPGGIRTQDLSRGAASGRSPAEIVGSNGGRFEGGTVGEKCPEILPKCRLPAAAHLLGSWVRIPPGAWIFVCCECRVLSGRGLRNELITRPEESYRLWCVVVCDLETSRMGAPYIYDISSLRVNM